jgi:hypothetical protein
VRAWGGEAGVLKTPHGIRAPSARSGLEEEGPFRGLGGVTLLVSRGRAAVPPFGLLRPAGPLC